MAHVWEDQDRNTHIEELSEDENDDVIEEESEQEEDAPEQDSVEHVSRGVNMIDLHHSPDTPYAESAPGAF